MAEFKWLTPGIPELWEAEASGSPRQHSVAPLYKKERKKYLKIIINENKQKKPHLKMGRGSGAPQWFSGVLRLP